MKRAIGHWFIGILFGFILAAGPRGDAREETEIRTPEASGNAVYTTLPSPQFMTRWLICGPFPVQETHPESLRVRERNQPPGGDTSRQRDERMARFFIGSLQQVRTFDFDLLTNQGGETAIQPRVGMSHPDGAGRELQWRLYESPENIVDLVNLFGARNNAVAYAGAEIVVAYPEIAAPMAQSLLLAFGADDADKIWLNGELIHEHWGGRSVDVDDERIPLNLKPGTNRLLFKIQNIERDWGFVCRLVTPEMLEKIHQDNQAADFSGGRMTPADVLQRNPSIFLFPIFVLAIVVIFIFAVLRSKFDL